MRLASVFVCLIAAIGLGGCLPSETFLEEFIAEEARPTVDASVTAIIDRDFDRLMNMAPDGATPEQAELIAEFINTNLPEGEASQIRLAGANSFTSQTMGDAANVTLSLTYLLTYEADDYRLDLRFEKQGDARWTFNWLNISSLSGADAHERIDFNFAGMSPERKIALAAALGSFSFIVFTLIASFRIKRIKRRIIWTVLIICAYPVFQFNWSTQAWSIVAPVITSSETATYFNLIELSFFGAGFMDYAPLEPALVTAALPLGALFFWYRVLRGGPTRKSLTPAPTAEG